MSVRAQGSRVEILSSRTEDQTEYANPDGSFTLEWAGAPVRTRASDGSWRPIDTTLMSGTSWVRPRSVAADVRFSKTGSTSGSVASAADGPRSIGLGWERALATPTVTGATAAYGLDGGARLEATARSDGFSLDVVLDRAPARVPVYRFPLKVGGLAAVARPDGGFDLRNGAGKAVFEIAPPVMWDSRTEGAGEPSHVVPVAAALVDKGQTLELRPDPRFFADPELTYPVTIDPTISKLGHVQDTMVDSANPDTSWGSYYALWVGLVSTNRKMRSLVKYNTTPIAGKHVTSAQLTAFNYYSGSCTAKTLNVYPVTSSWTTSATWNTQPTITTSGSYAASKSFAHGNEGLGCADAAESIDVTNMVAAWANGTLTNYGLTLRASETDTTAHKKFCSMNDDPGATEPNCRVPANNPELSVTYNSYPGVPSNLAMSESYVNPYSPITRVRTLTPAFSAKVSDADGGATNMINVEVSPDPAYNDTTYTWTGTSSGVASGLTASVIVPSANALPAAVHVRYRMRGYDGTDYSAWSSYKSFTVDTVLPVAPTISCPDFTSGAWGSHTGAETCTLDTTSTDGFGYNWGLDDPAMPNQTLDTVDGTGGDPLQITFTPAAGWHTLTLQTIDAAFNLSTTATFSFGVGTGALTSPAEGDRTQAGLTLAGTAPSSFDGVTYKYRYGTIGSFLTVPTSEVTIPGSGTHPSWPYTTSTVAGSTRTFANLSWNLAATIAAIGGADGAVQVQVCYTTGGANSTCTTTTPTVTLDRTAFAESGSTRDLGPGTLAPLTGDFAVNASDVTAGQFAVGRSLTTLRPTGTQPGTPGIFGPGWTAGLPAPAGLSEYAVDEHTAVGFIALIGPNGDTRTYTKQADGTYTGVSDATDGSVITVNAGPTQITLTETDGTVTTWALANGRWGVVSVAQTGTETATSYSYDSSGRPTRVLAPVPTGVTCPAYPTALVRGCQALTFTYAATTTATGTNPGQWGDYAGQAASIQYTAYDPAASGMATITGAQYQYDTTGHLRATWDPRITPNLVTTYSYDPNGRIATLTPPGQNAWNMDYDTAGRLVDVWRTDPVNGVAKQEIAYGVPITGTGAAIDLSLTQTSTWGESVDLPWTGTAIFPASHTVPTGPNGGYAPGATDWKYADLAYLDVNGREVNTASYGAGGWQITSTAHDPSGNTLWELTAENRNQALNPVPGVTDPFVAGLPSSITRARQLTTKYIYSDLGVDGTVGFDLQKVIGPVHPVVLASGQMASARTYTTYKYDEGKPDSTEYHLVTTTKVQPVVQDGSATTGPADVNTVNTLYIPHDGKPLTDPTSGWVLRMPTETDQVMADGSSLRTWVVRYDSSGRTIDTRMPASNGTDAGRTNIRYYIAGTDASYPSCGLHGEWAGLPCRVFTQADPSSGPTIPVKAYTYNMYGQPTVIIEKDRISGTAIRTTTVTYDNAGRQQTASVTCNATQVNCAPTQTVTTGYSTTTGLQTTLSTPDGATLTTGYDAIGQVTSYTDADANLTTTGYNLDGNVTSVNDGKGTTTYAYDITDALGREEHRRLVTTMNTGMGSAPSTFTHAYDGDGSGIRQVFPNGLTAATIYDNAGNDTSLSYTMTGWASPLAFTQTPAASALTISATSPQSAQTYSYDPAGRLTQVQDADLAMNTCHTRAYTFNLNSDRTQITDYPDSGNGLCTTSTTPTTTTSTYDEADRITNPGYSYDTLGRTTAVPAADVAGGANLTVGYDANDIVASLAQSSESKTFTLDPAMRLRTATDTGGARPGTITNHYATNSDSPAWILEPDGTWTRNVVGFDGNLAAIQTSTGAVGLDLANMRGDIVAIVDDSPGTAGPSAYFEQTEYGKPRLSTTVNPTRYGWLGSKQRSSDSVAGLVLMGRRLYNPNTGLFLSADPVPGGSANAYSYCSGDPINCIDTTGLYSVFRHSTYLNLYYSRWETYRRWQTAAKMYDFYLVAAIISACCGWGYTVVLGYLTHVVGKIRDGARRALDNGGCLKLRVYYWLWISTSTYYVGCG